MNPVRAAMLAGALAGLLAGAASGQTTSPSPAKSAAASGHGHGADDIADMHVLETLRRAGADLGKAHTPVYFANYPTEAAMKAARKDLEAAGFTITKAGRSGDGKAWILIVTRTMPLSIDNVRHASRAMKASTDKHGGRYDGWEAEPRS